VIKDNDTLWVAGANNYGQLGKGDNVHTNQFVYVLPDVKLAVAGPEFHSFILKNDFTFGATGYNGNGQLGTMDKFDRNIFVRVYFLLLKALNKH
ncbi:MAG: hypothetical protein N2258_06645, partial [Brevinematales bacterium]|nr:hypothetical protein [Brevinematales bacterium]